MQQEPFLRIALTLHSNPGAYALLVGSGLSTSAGIPTGWGIVGDLARRLAAASGLTPEDPISWYREAFGEEPDYSRLLGRVGRTQSDRRALLRQHFEPSEEDREAGRKVPTAAHNAIAELVRLGYVRMILTTNFDPLIEKALEQANLMPLVLSTADAISGAPPYAHGGVFLMKLHGDYRDSRIRNTSEELSTYPPVVKRYLDRVLDDFGLIICGWSSDSDVALRDALMRAPNRRFATYWLTRDRLRESAERLVNQRKAEVVHISGAETFFPELVEMLRALRESELPDPLSTAVAVANTKRYLSDERHRIRMHDLLHDQTEQVHREVSSAHFVLDTPEPDADTIARRLHQYESVTGKLAEMMAAIAYHGGSQHSWLLTRSLQRLSPGDTPGGTSYDVWREMRAYPVLLIIYAVGIPALAAKKFGHLAAILLTPMIPAGRLRGQLLVKEANPRSALTSACRALPGRKRAHFPGSDYLAQVLEPLVQGYVPGHKEFLAAFDDFEYFLSLVYWHVARGNREWAPMGSFVWRRWGYDEDPLLEEFLNEAERNGNAWGLYSAGFFNDANGLHQVAQQLRDWLRKMREQGAWI